MKCLQCGGGLEYVQNAQFARCSHCCALFKNDNRHLSPIGPCDPNGSATYAAQLGFAQRKPAKVLMTGGSLKGAPDSIVASANATVTVAGTSVTGKTKATENGKIVGVK